MDVFACVDRLQTVASKTEAEVLEIFDSVIAESVPKINAIHGYFRAALVLPLVVAGAKAKLTPDVVVARLTAAGLKWPPAKFTKHAANVIIGGLMNDSVVPPKVGLLMLLVLRNAFPDGPASNVAGEIPDGSEAEIPAEFRGDDDAEATGEYAPISTADVQGDTEAAAAFIPEPVSLAVAPYVESPIGFVSGVGFEGTTQIDEPGPVS